MDSRKQNPLAVDEGARLDDGLIAKARALIESLVDVDCLSQQPLLASLVGTLLEIWESASNAPEPYQDVLATLENGVRGCACDGSISPDRIRAIREALTTLAQPKLVSEHAEAIRREFIRAGFDPLQFLRSAAGLNSNRSSAVGLGASGGLPPRESKT